jgi:hypothetical protein
MVSVIDTIQTARYWKVKNEGEKGINQVQRIHTHVKTGYSTGPLQNVEIMATGTIFDPAPLTPVSCPPVHTIHISPNSTPL